MKISGLAVLLFLSLALLGAGCAGLASPSSGPAFSLAASPEPVRSTDETTLTVSATLRDGSTLDLSDPARVRDLMVKVVSSGANDVREFRPTSGATRGVVTVSLYFVYGGLYSVLVDAVVDGRPVHGLLLLNVIGPGENTD